MAGPERGEADGGLERGDVGEGFDAGGGFVADEDVLDFESGTTEEVVMNGADLDVAMEGTLERGANALAVRSGAEVGREDAGRGDEEESGQDDAGDCALKSHTGRSELRRPRDATAA